MRNSETRTIHLGLYGRSGAKTIKLLFAGLREPLDHTNKSMHQIGRRFTGEQTRVRVDTTGEVVLDVYVSHVTGSWSRYYADREIPYSAFAKGFDTTYIKGWLACELRLLSNGRQADEVFQLHPASKTSQTSRVWEVQATAAALSGEDVEDKYGKKVFDMVVGQPADPVRTEVNDVIAEETRRIVNEYRLRALAAHNEMLAKIVAIRREYRRVKAELGKRERAEITAMKKDILAA